jgi:hypothetical protein
MFTSQALNSGVSVFASPTTGVSEFGCHPFLVCAHEAPVLRDADDVDGLAVADQGLDPLRHHRLGLDRAALRPDADPAALGDALLLGELLRDLHEGLRLEDRVDPGVLGPAVEVLGQAVARRRVGELLRVAEIGQIVLEDAGRGRDCP